MAASASLALCFSGRKLALSSYRSSRSTKSVATSSAAMEAGPGRTCATALVKNAAPITAKSAGGNPQHARLHLEIASADHPLLRSPDPSVEVGSCSGVPSRVGVPLVARRHLARG